MKRCSKCGQTKPLNQFSKSKQQKDGLDCWCKSCVNAKGKVWYQANKERNHERTNKWRREHPEPGRAYSKKWKEENKEKRIAYEAERYAKNRPYFIEKMKKYQKEHPEKYRQYNSDRLRLINATKQGKVDYSEIGIRDKYICHICKKKVSKTELSFDHVVPLSKGGTHTYDNIKVAHRVCNAKKGKKL